MASIGFGLINECIGVHLIFPQVRSRRPHSCWANSPNQSNGFARSSPVREIQNRIFGAYRSIPRLFVLWPVPYKGGRPCATNSKITGGRIQCQSQQLTPLTEYRRHSARPDWLLLLGDWAWLIWWKNPRRLGIWSSLPVHQSSAFRPVLAEWTKPYLGWRKPVQRVWYFVGNSTITW